MVKYGKSSWSNQLNDISSKIAMFSLIRALFTPFWLKLLRVFDFDGAFDGVKSIWRSLVKSLKCDEAPSHCTRTAYTCLQKPMNSFDCVRVSRTPLRRACPFWRRIWRRIPNFRGKYVFERHILEKQDVKKVLMCAQNLLIFNMSGGRMPAMI